MIVTEYICPICKRRFRPADPQVSCLVVHQGGCCHYGEILIIEPTD